MRRSNPVKDGDAPRIERTKQTEVIMSVQTGRIGRWCYALAILLFVLGSIAATAMGLKGSTQLLDSVRQAYDITRLTQVIVPGSAEVAFPQPGAYAVYYEYRSSVDGVEYVASSYKPPALACSLRSNVSGAEVPLVRDYVLSNAYFTGDGSRAGILAMSTTIHEPGIYTFSCQHSNGSPHPKFVLAVGQNMIWELLGAVARPLVWISAGTLTALGSVIVATGLAIAGAAWQYSRRASRHSNDQRRIEE
jgi:hypothetical protein